MASRLFGPIEPPKPIDSRVLLKVSLVGTSEGLVDNSSYRHSLLNDPASLTGMEVRTTPQGKFWGMTAGAGTKARWVLNKDIACRTIAYWAYRFKVPGHSWCMEGRNAENTQWIVGSALSLYGRENICFNNQAPVACHIPVAAWDLKWKHIVYSLANGTCKMYLDGELVKTETYAAPAVSVCHNFGIRYDDQDSSNNAIAAFKDLWIYNTELSAAEIKQLYLSEKF